MITKILSFLTIPISYYLTLSLSSLILNLNLQSEIQLYFSIAFGICFIIGMFFISANNFFSVYNHESCHLIWSLLSFQKPKSFKVEDSGKGEYSYYGKRNIMIVLSPYFFPIYFIFMLIIGELSSFTPILISIFGALAGWTLSVQIKQARPDQTDLNVYGKIVSYIYIVFFQLLFLSMVIAYLHNRISGIKNMYVDIYNDIVSGILNLIIWLS